MSEAFDEFDARLRRQFWWRKQSCCWIPPNIAAQTKFIENCGMYARHGQCRKHRRWKVEYLRREDHPICPQLKFFCLLKLLNQSNSIGRRLMVNGAGARARKVSILIVSPAIYLSSKFHLIYHHPDCPRAGFVILITRYMNSRLAEDDLLRNVAHSFVSSFFFFKG